MSELDCLAIEHAALAAWPARETEHHDGWVLRASDGVTKRANSATVLAPTPGEPAAWIHHCEDFYRARGLPCIIRLPSFVDPGGLDSALADRGYQFLDLSLVLYRRLDPLPAAPEMDFRVLAQADWLDHFAALGRLDAASRAGQAGILGRMPGAVLCAVLVYRGEVVAAGLGVVHGGLLGIFDVVTRVDLRGQGFGSGLIGWMLRRGQESRARGSYLQVVGGNVGAVAVYERLEFRRVYDYWYRVAGR